jgi:hypothetical protein
MTTERDFFTVDATRTRADLRVNGNPAISHDQESEVVLLDQLAAKADVALRRTPRGSALSVASGSLSGDHRGKALARADTTIPAASRASAASAACRRPHASISALLQELSRSIRATCPAWRAIASRKSSFSATNPGRACDSRLAGPGPRARAHRPYPAGQPQPAAPGGHPACARRPRPARAGRPRQ